MNEVNGVSDDAADRAADSVQQLVAPAAERAGTEDEARQGQRRVAPGKVMKIRLEIGENLAGVMRLLIWIWLAISIFS